MAILYGAKTPADLSNVVGGITLPMGAKPRIIDSTAALFQLAVNQTKVIPSVAQPASKQSLIDLYDQTRSVSQPEYKTTSLGSKRLDQVVADLVALTCTPLAGN